MTWVILFAGVVAICLVAALLLGWIGGGMGAATTSLRHEPLPDEPLTEADLDALEFDVTARGYRMSQVDGVIDRLRRELGEKGEEIAVLRDDLGRDANPRQASGPEGPETPSAPEAPSTPDTPDAPPTPNAPGVSGE